MVRTMLFVVLGVSGGLALATLFQGNTMERLEPPDALSVGQQSSPAVVSRTLEERLNLLEAVLQKEIAYRTTLQEELAALNEELADLREQGPQRRGRSGERIGEQTEAIDPEETPASFSGRFSSARNGDPTERRLGQLTQAGFSPDEAQRIARRESELRMQALNEQYEASRQGQSFDRAANWSAGLGQLRQELGDTDYERYLAATGQSTRITVRQVLASSPGEAAGLQPGDEIVGYGGERVFSNSDLNRLTLEGSPGQTVAVEVLRDGQPTQVFVPRGPIGITSGGGGPFGGRGR